jgi:hypothetical protein
MANKSENAVAGRKSAEVVQFDASMFEADAGVGLENMGQDDLALPFLKILGGMSKELDDLEEARKGDIYNTVTGKVYKGKEGVNVIPVAYQRRFIQWAPLGSGTGAPVAIYVPGEARPETKRSETDHKDYLTDGSEQYIEETHQHFVVLINEDGSTETALIALKSTGLKKSRKWNSMIASLTVQGKNGPFTPPRFSHVYHLKTILEENSKGSWHGWEISRVGPVQEMNLYNKAKDFNASIQAGDVDVKHQDDSTGGGMPSDEVPF